MLLDQLRDMLTGRFAGVVDGQDVPDLRLGADGRVAVAYPFSATPTPHVVRLPAGVTAYAMCAIDGLGIASMLGAPVEIRSSDPVTGAAIAVRVPASGDDAEWDPDSTVVLAGILASGCDDLRSAVDVCCGTVNFFASGESAVSWMAEHPVWMALSWIATGRCGLALRSSARR